jgi:peptide-methionine (R)-S-oxide reductase
MIKKVPNQQQADVSERRTVMKFGIATIVGCMPVTRAIADALSELSSTPLVSIEKFSADGVSLGMERRPKVMKSEAEWIKLLSADEYRVARLGESENAYAGTYWNSHTAGIFQCICCDSAVFDSKAKYESGTGWPSFWQPISALNIKKNSDNAILCSLCDAHLGQVFGDGPGPTGLRYRINSVALKLLAKS